MIEHCLCEDGRIDIFSCASLIVQLDGQDNSQAYRIIGELIVEALRQNILEELILELNKILNKSILSLVTRYYLMSWLATKKISQEVVNIFGDIFSKEDRNTMVGFLMSRKEYELSVAIGIFGDEDTHKMLVANLPKEYLMYVMSEYPSVIRMLAARLEGE